MIQLTETLAVVADDQQYILGIPTERKREGKAAVTMRRPRYYPTLAGAVRAAVSQAMREKVAADEITTLRAFLEEAERMDARFRELLAPLET